MVIIGSARHDENNRYSGGAKGDSLQTSTPDYKGEVSMQNFYLHKKGWNVIRAIKPADAKKIAERMQTACNNKNIGYSQSDRLSIIKDGIDTQKPSNCDCSSLVRECVKEATGKDPGNFTTYNAVGCLENTKLFIPAFPYTSTTVLQTGDILCTQTKGHIVVVVEGASRKEATSFDGYYPIYKGGSISIVTALQEVGESDTSKAHRKIIAEKNGIANYTGTSEQNQQMLKLLKKGKLVRA